MKSVIAALEAYSEVELLEFIDNKEIPAAVRDLWKKSHQGEPTAQFVQQGTHKGTATGNVSHARTVEARQARTKIGRDRVAHAGLIEYFNSKRNISEMEERLYPEAWESVSRTGKKKITTPSTKGQIIKAIISFLTAGMIPS